jgi:hypothetical protein
LRLNYDLIYSTSEFRHNIAQMGRNCHQPEVTIDAVTDVSRAILNCCKDDADPFRFNVRDSQLGINCLGTQWCMAKLKQGFTCFEDIPVDQFLINYTNQRPLVRGIFKNLLAKQEPFKLKAICNLPPFGDWRDNVLKWYNGWCNALSQNCYRLKAPQLYLWGDFNTGKTSFIDTILLRGIHPCHMYRPNQSAKGKNNSDFNWSGFDPKKHLIVVRDEFDLLAYDQNLLKLILQGIHWFFFIPIHVHFIPLYSPFYFYIY